MLEFYMNVAVLAAILAISAVALHSLIGTSGVFSSAQATFYGVGGYAGALVSIHLSDSFLLSAIVGIVAAGLAALILAITAVRIRGDYFVVASLAFAEIGTTVMNQWKSVTGGNDGLSGIPVATIGPLQIESAGQFLVLTVILLVIVAAVFHLLLGRAPFGRMLRAMSEDDLALASLGHSPARLRIMVVVLAGMASGLGGVAYAFYVTFVDPSGFTLTGSVLFVTMVVLGGAKSLWGAVVGSVVVEFGTASLNLLPFPPANIGPLQQMVIGAVLILVMVFRPDGIAGAIASIATRIHRGRTPTGAVTGQGAIPGLGVSDGK